MEDELKMVLNADYSTHTHTMQPGKTSGRAMRTEHVNIARELFWHTETLIYTGHKATILPYLPDLSNLTAKFVRIELREVCVMMARRSNSSKTQKEIRKTTVQCFHEEHVSLHPPFQPHALESRAAALC